MTHYINERGRRGRHSRCLAASLLFTLFASVSAAQPPSAVRAPAILSTLEATAGSDLEGYLRALALVGAVPDPGMTVRGYAPRALVTLAAASRAHPYRSRLRGGARCRAEATVLPIASRAAWTSDFPFAINDGPIWEGRGLTGVASAGLTACAGPLSLVLQPVVYATRNADYALAGVPPDAASEYVDAVRGTQIDYPQRFGRESYRRADPGQSTLRLDVGPLAIGASTAAQVWGPAAVHPLLLGNNAGGFPHVFLGTSGTPSIGVGRVTARLVLGRPADSPYTPRGSRARSLAGGVFALSPRVVPGLEVGLGRVFHRWVPESGLGPADLFTVFESYFQSAAAMRRKNDPDSPDYTPDNQLASVFASWMFPRAGLRFYGELLKNDNNLNVRELITEPDHASAYMLGLERGSLSADGRRLLVFRGEVVNGRVTHLARVRDQAGAYEHFPIVQGHTNRGQLLGSVGVLGGGAQHLAIEAYTPRQRLAVHADRLVRQQPIGEGAPAALLDVQHAIGVSATRFAGRLELTASLRYVRELNRNFVGDASNWQIGAGLTYRPPWYVGARAGR